MIAAVLSAALPVLLGALLAFSSSLGARSRGPVRTFAAFAALAVVLLVLLPAAAAHSGAFALLLFGLGMALPALVERVSVRSKSGEHSLSGERLVVLGLAAHQAVDGLEVGAAWALGTGALGVSVAIASHSVPLLAVLLLEVVRHRGRASAVGWAGGLALVTVVGAVAGHSGAASLPGAEAWLPALLGGLMVHVVWHHHREDAPQSTGSRWLDFAAAAAGFVLPLAIMESGGTHHHGSAEALIGAAQRVLWLGSPWALLGLGLAAARAGGWRALPGVVSRFGPRLLAGWVVLAFLDGFVFGEASAGMAARLSALGPPSGVAPMLLVGLLLRSAWTEGPRAWVGEIGGGDGHAHGHGEGHARGEGHAHGDDHQGEHAHEGEHEDQGEREGEQDHEGERGAGSE